MLLPANGSGTLHRLNSGFPGVGVVRAKTGTLGRVSTVVGYLGRPEGTLLVALMYNGGRPWAARQAQWKLFRELGAHGVVIPTDTLPEPPPVQLGGEQTAPPPAWWTAGGVTEQDSADTAVEAPAAERTDRGSDSPLRTGRRGHACRHAPFCVRPRRRPAQSQNTTCASVTPSAPPSG